MQPSPDRDRSGPAPLLVRKRDGRTVPFDPARVATALLRALGSVGQDDAALARDLSAVVVTYLGGHAGEGVIAATEIAHLVHEVLLGARCTAAAAAFRLDQEARERSRAQLRVRAAGEDGVRDIPRGSTPAEAPPDPEAWSKGRVVSLLLREADLPGELAEQVAADVERSLFASGLRSVSAALLREWVDNELFLRGHPARLGQHQFVGLQPHELREVLASPAADSELGARLLQRYALREVYSAEVVQAHEEGLLDLENLRAGARLDSAVLAPWSLPAVARLRDPREARRELPLLLRQIARLACREVVLRWDGPPLSQTEATDLLAQLAEPPAARDSTARLVLALAEGVAEPGPWLAALDELRSGPAARAGAALPGLRLSCEGLSDETLRRACELEAADARLAFAACEPQPMLVTGSVALDVARLALAAGPRAVREFLGALERAVILACQALAAQEALRSTGAARSRLRTVTGQPEGALPSRSRVGLCGWSEAASMLLGDGARARENRLDLAAAMGERVAAGLARAGADHVRLGRADVAARERFGRLDLAAFPDARDRLPLAGHREGFRYDGAVLLAPGADAEAAGEHAAHTAARLHLPPDAPAPRSTGSADQRVAFLRAYSRVVAPRRDVAPCA